VQLIRLSGDPERCLRFLGWTRLGDNREVGGLAPIHRARPRRDRFGSAKGPEDFTYDLDCVDAPSTATVTGRGFRREGWLPVERDPTAALVAEWYYPRIESLRGNGKRKAGHHHRPRIGSLITGTTGSGTGPGGTSAR